jgi:hypothetical protein
MSNEPVQALGTGIVLETALSKAHGVDAVVRDDSGTNAGYQGSPEPNQWFGGPENVRVFAREPSTSNTHRDEENDGGDFGTAVVRSDNDREDKSQACQSAINADDEQRLVKCFRARPGHGCFLERLHPRNDR